MPEGDSKINIKRLEEIIALVITKVEEPKHKHLSFFGWDDRYELHGSKGVIFDTTKDLPMLRALGLKGEEWNVTYTFFGFDELLSLYPYAECILNVLEAHRHNDDVQRVAEQIKDLQSALSLANQQIKDAEHNTFHKVLACIKR